MVQCCVCPWDKCSENCPTLDVLPYEGPLKEESIRKAQTLQAAGMEFAEIKEKWKDAGSYDDKNKLINKWIEDYESREKDELYHIIQKRVLIIQKQRIIEEKEKRIAKGKNLLKSLRTVLNAPVVADEGLPGFKRCSTNHN